MKHRFYNRIAEAIATETISEAKKAIQDTSGTLPLSEGIPAADRKTLVKINVSNKVFVEDALVAGKSRLEILPSYISMDELQKRVDSFEGFDDLIHEVDDFRRKLLDTQALIGSEAYAIALSLYHFFEQACKDGVPGTEAICKQLGERFKNQGNKKDKGAGQEGVKS